MDPLAVSSSGRGVRRASSLKGPSFQKNEESHTPRTAVRGITSKGSVMLKDARVAPMDDSKVPNSARGQPPNSARGRSGDYDTSLGLSTKVESEGLASCINMKLSDLKVENVRDHTVYNATEQGFLDSRKEKMRMKPGRSIKSIKKNPTVNKFSLVHLANTTANSSSYRGMVRTLCCVYIYIYIYILLLTSIAQVPFNVIGVPDCSYSVFTLLSCFSQ
jgi:hypothetical protein